MLLEERRRRGDLRTSASQAEQASQVPPLALLLRMESGSGADVVLCAQ
jgi:hypothetical protein